MLNIKDTQLYRNISTWGCLFFFIGFVWVLIGIILLAISEESNPSSKSAGIAILIIGIIFWVGVICLNVFVTLKMSKIELGEKYEDIKPRWTLISFCTLFCFGPYLFLTKVVKSYGNEAIDETQKEGLQPINQNETSVISNALQTGPINLAVTRPTETTIENNHVNSNVVSVSTPTIINDSNPTINTPVNIDKNIDETNKNMNQAPIESKSHENMPSASSNTPSTTTPPQQAAMPNQVQQTPLMPQQMPTQQFVPPQQAVMSSQIQQNPAMSQQMPTQQFVPPQQVVMPNQVQQTPPMPQQMPTQQFVPPQQVVYQPQPTMPLNTPPPQHMMYRQNPYPPQQQGQFVNPSYQQRSPFVQQPSPYQNPTVIYGPQQQPMMPNNHTAMFQQPINSNPQQPPNNNQGNGATENNKK